MRTPLEVEVDVSDVLTAISNPGRRELLERLARRGKASAAELAADASITRQAVVKQLRFLQDAKLVTSERGSHGAQLFRVAPRALRQLASSLASTAARWERSLASTAAQRERSLPPLAQHSSSDPLLEAPEHGGDADERPQQTVDHPCESGED